MDAGKNSGSGKGKLTRHLPHQTERLEAFYEEYTHPNQSQRAELATELGLTPTQVKNWFQNKRNVTKVQKDYTSNATFNEENERLRCENEVIPEILKNQICLACNPNEPIGIEARKPIVEKLKIENLQLQEQIKKISNELMKKTGKPVRHLLAMSPDALENVLKASAGSFRDLQSGGSYSPESISSDSQIAATAANEATAMSSQHKDVIAEQALIAMEELITLMVDNETLWFRSPSTGGYILNLENYSCIFPKSSHLKTSSSRIKASKETFTLPIAALDLFEMLMDTNRWADIFPTLVMEAWNFETLHTVSLGEGILHLIHTRTHILSPLVAPREFFFFRHGYRADQGIWLIADASSDSFRKIQDNSAPTCCWKFPSGVMITSIDDKASLVTWIEHTEYDESLNHPLYRNLLSTPHGYGATRWLSTLERMQERSLYSANHATATLSCDSGTQGVLSAPEARKSFLMLSHRMIKDMCAILSLPSRSDLPEPTNGKVRVSVRTSNEFSGQPIGKIVAASTSVWLPLTFRTLFDFLRDVSRRHEWDAMLGGSPMNEITRLATGAHPGNYVSLSQHTMFKEEQQLWIQENSLDHLGALVVFAGIHPSVMQGTVSSGEDTSMVPILPCGFLISGDDSIANGVGSSDGASTSSGSGSRPSGSLLTLTLQIPVWSNPAEAANYLNNLISTTIQNLKFLLGCPELI